MTFGQLAAVALAAGVVFLMERAFAWVARLARRCVRADMDYRE